MSDYQAVRRAKTGFAALPMRIGGRLAGCTHRSAACLCSSCLGPISSGQHLRKEVTTTDGRTALGIGVVFGADVRHVGARNRESVLYPAV